MTDSGRRAFLQEINLLFIFVFEATDRGSDPAASSRATYLSSRLFSAVKCWICNSIFNKVTSGKTNIQLVLLRSAEFPSHLFWFLFVSVGAVAAELAGLETTLGCVRMSGLLLVTKTEHSPNSLCLDGLTICELVAA